MAGMDWFRWHHGSVNDPKFQLVARKASCSVAEVIALWACLLESASQSEERGKPASPDFESIDCALGLEDGKAFAIYQQMIGRDLICKETGRLINWEKRQPKRERDDDTAAERKRLQREREQEKIGVTEDNEPCHTMSHHFTPREEERRVDIKPTTSDEVVVGNDVANTCPHQKIIAAFHDILPVATRVRVWNNTRSKHLQARWRESSKRQNIDWWERFFSYVGESEFLTGRAQAAPGRDPFVISLDWLINPTNFAKVIEGKYHNSRRMGNEN